MPASASGGRWYRFQCRSRKNRSSIFAWRLDDNAPSLTHICDYYIVAHSSISLLYAVLSILEMLAFRSVSQVRCVVLLHLGPLRST